jgi:septal ring factor EnvC (AmiA/AmiB activator)
MTPEYKDVLVLQHTGCWPDGKQPKWALDKAEELHCFSTSAAVIEYALKLEISALEDQIAKERAEHECALRAEWLRRQEAETKLKTAEEQCAELMALLSEKTSEFEAECERIKDEYGI